MYQLEVEVEYVQQIYMLFTDREVPIENNFAQGLECTDWFLPWKYYMANFTMSRNDLKSCISPLTELQR